MSAVNDNINQNKSLGFSRQIGQVGGFCESLSVLLISQCGLLRASVPILLPTNIVMSLLKYFFVCISIALISARNIADQKCPERPVEQNFDIAKVKF
jgi:hypothetical protein